MDKTVSKYINEQPSPQKEILKKLRKIISQTFPKLKEGFKLGVPWYQDKFYLVGLRDSVNLGVAVKSLSKKEMSLFKGNGKIMRHLKFHSLQEINDTEVVKLLKIVNNKSRPCKC
ncbi:MAG: DUF1801 domain-containing protein [Candidatus Woesebacteria bacterium]|jgi:hypothetical protein